MENTAEGSGGGFQDLLSAALSESGLTDDLDFSDLFGGTPASAPSTTTPATTSVAAASTSNAVVTQVTPVPAGVTRTVAPSSVKNDPVPQTISTGVAPLSMPDLGKTSSDIEQSEVDLFSQALQQLTAINQKVGPVATNKKPTTTAQQQVSQFVKTSTPKQSSVRPRVAQLIDTPPPAPREELDTLRAQTITSNPGIPSSNGPTVTLSASPNITASLAPRLTHSTSVVRALPANVSKPGITVVRSMTPRTATGTFVRAVPPGPGQTILRTVASNAGQGTLLQTNQGTIIRTIQQPVGSGTVKTLQTGPTQGTVVRAIRTVNAAGQQVIRTVQQIPRGVAGQQIIRALQPVKRVGSPIQIVQQQPGQRGTPLTIASGSNSSNSIIQVRALPQTVQLTGNGSQAIQLNNGQPRFATIVSSNNTGQTVSLINSTSQIRPAAGGATRFPGRIPAKIVQQIGPDGTTRTVRIVTVSPGMLPQTGNTSKTVTKLAQVVTNAGKMPVVNSPHMFARTTTGASIVNNGAVTVVRPSVTQAQAITIAPKPGSIGSMVANSTSGMSPIVQHRVVQSVRRSPSPLTVNSVINNNNRAKSGTPPPVNGVVKTQLTEKDVSRLWANDEIKFKKLVQPTASKPRSPALGEQDIPRTVIEEEAEEDDEVLGRAETYADYIPSKLKIGERHPDSVVETSSLSSVEPPDVWYKLAIPETTIDYGHLSALQLESITYACQKHDTHLPSTERAGYLIGDGAGVGKGRTIAGVIFENYLQGRKRALWLSVSNDLRVDAERDLRDIGANKIEVYPLNKFKYAKISSKINGSVKKGVIFATYSSLIGESQSGGKYRTRLKQLLHWLNRDFDGVIVFDECHKAKNLCPVGSSKPTKTGLTVLELQNKLPRARIVYASATGASEPRNMAYMTRLGLWGKGTPFKEFNDFINAVEKRGVGAMELVAMDMKLRGMYIARQLSFHGTSFKIQEIPVPKEFVRIYNESVKLWVDARAMFQQCADLIQAEQRMKKSMWGQFWSAHQRFFKYLCISAKVPFCVKTARDALKNGKCVVIGLQSTGEARTLEQLEESGGELNDFVSTAKGVFQSLVEKHFPAPDRRKTLDMFGFGSSMYESPVPSPIAGQKRKKDALKGFDSKRIKSEVSDDSQSDSSASESIESEPEISLSESESESEPDSDDFNPFGNGSDSDDDPWLKKSKKKPKKEKKKKEKKKKEKKKKKSKKPKKDDDDSDDDIDKEFDRALEAAGLKANQIKNQQLAQNSRINSAIPGMDDVNRAVEMKRELLTRVEKLGDYLPPNTLDQLIDDLGGTENVAEMTGRKGRVVSTDDGVQYESRSEVDAPLEILNLTEKQRFMDGEKSIAIISEAASSGISLQADRRANNQKRRVHITLELPWSADRAVQQFGRTHRSNQVNAPEYVFLISELAGERRFAATVAKRLESLGALTHGDRRATESRDLSRFNIDNKYGRAALEAVMKSVLHIESPVVPSPEGYPGDFFEDVKIALVGVGLVTIDERMGIPSLEKDYNNISKFLNRILGTPVELQNALFSYFTETLTTIILQAKRNGRWDMGILDLGGGGENVRKLSSKNFTSNFSGMPVRTTLHSVSVERGMTWERAMLKWRENSGPEDGFYISQQARNMKRTCVLVIGMSGRRKEKLYSIYRPNTGLQQRAESLEKIKATYKKVMPDEAQYYWQDQFEASAVTCSHAYWCGNCKRASIGLPCEVGVRCRTYHILGGSVLGCWTKVETVLASLPGGHASRMQIIRIRTDDGHRIVGTLVPDAAISPLTNLLSQDITKSAAAPSPLSQYFSPQLQQQQQRLQLQQQQQQTQPRSVIQHVNQHVNQLFSPSTSGIIKRPSSSSSSSSSSSFQATFSNSLGLNTLQPMMQATTHNTTTTHSNTTPQQQNNASSKPPVAHLSMPMLL